MAPTASAGKLSPGAEALAGAIGAAFANFILFPIDVISTQIQIGDDANPEDSSTPENDNTPRSAPPPSIMARLRRIVEKHGIPGLYVGLSAGLLQSASSNLFFFYWHSLIRRAYAKYFARNSQISTATELGLGAVAGGVSRMFTTPLSVIATRQQTMYPDLSMFRTLLEILRTEGFTSLWRGIRASLILTINPAITYGFYERLRTVYISRRRSGSQVLGAMEAFWIGAITKALATVVTYPLILAKVRMQGTKGGEGKGKGIKYKGFMDVLIKVVESDGILGLFTGMEAQLIKSVLTQALLFASKEEVVRWTRVLLVR
ncbi:mitochondrial carrier domain-containing protein [Cladochytrium replicatum]|nr:mitochondrial carrier domain-containing protein [Cladochytrium replicatum]